MFGCFCRAFTIALASSGVGESSATVTVWQPIVDPITKIDRSGRLDTPNPLTVNLAADIMNFRIEACNTTGQAPAYSLLFNDVLGNPFNENSISGPVNGAGQPDVYINGVLGVSGVDYMYTPPAGRGGTPERAARGNTHG